jgi:glycosyltransferase involved in cell wall biosynthesis
VIRCAFVNHYTGYGGAELMLLTLLERLDRSRVRPVLMTPGEGLLTDGARKLGVEVRVVPVAPSLLGATRGGAGSRLGAASIAVTLPAAAARLARAIASARADVVVTNSAKAHVYGSIAGRLARRPVVWRMHDTVDSSDFGGSTRRLLLAIGRWAPRLVLSVSDSAGRALVEGGIPAERVVTLYNGIDLDALRAGAARAPSAANGVPRVGSVGRITPLKGHAVVIDAAARLLERGVDARFVIAGAAAREAPGHLEELRARAQGLGIAERVDLISPFGDLAELLSGLDVLVHASVLPDSLPTTVIESMALGKPVVATELGGAPELVRDAETGFLVPPGDPDRMADAIAALIDSPERRASVGRAAFDEATARFDVQAFTDAFTGHLERAARRPAT